MDQDPSCRKPLSHAQPTLQACFTINQALFKDLVGQDIFYVPNFS